jgi:hypothetical protein
MLKLLAMCRAGLVPAAVAVLGLFMTSLGTFAQSSGDSSARGFITQESGADLILGRELEEDGPHRMAVEGVGGLLIHNLRNQREADRPTYLHLPSFARLLQGREWERGIIVIVGSRLTAVEQNGETVFVCRGDGMDRGEPGCLVEVELVD